jgi:hypothetical protein
MRNLQANGKRLWASLMALAEIGATPKGRGVSAGDERPRRPFAPALHRLDLFASGGRSDRRRVKRRTPLAPKARGGLSAQDRNVR